MNMSIYELFYYVKIWQVLISVIIIFVPIALYRHHCYKEFKKRRIVSIKERMNKNEKIRK